MDNTCEYELTNFSSFLKENPNNNRKYTISWEEKYFIINPPPAQGTAAARQSTGITAVDVTRTIQDLLELVRQRLSHAWNISGHHCIRQNSFGVGILI
jgi:hypothetical protein